MKGFLKLANEDPRIKRGEESAGRAEISREGSQFSHYPGMIALKRGVRMGLGHREEDYSLIYSRA